MPDLFRDPTPIPADARAILEAAVTRLEEFARIARDAIEADGTRPLMRTGFAVAYLAVELPKLGKSLNKAHSSIYKVTSGDRFEEELSQLTRPPTDPEI